MIRHNAISRSFVYVSCWHCDENESAAMWKIYGAPGPGIAITTKSTKLKRSVDKFSDVMFFGKVNYVDVEVHVIDAANILYPFITKRHNYAYEKEARIVFWDSEYQNLLPLSRFNSDAEFFEEPSEQEMSKFVDLVKPPPGRAIPCDISCLIEEVWISPTSPPWYDDTIAGLLRSFDIKAKIKRSDLRTMPLK